MSNASQAEDAAQTLVDVSITTWLLARRYGTLRGWLHVELRCRPVMLSRLRIA